jgi:5-methylcytosine-specific restriction endonuclease McrA
VLERDGYQCQVRLPGCTAIATDADHIGDRMDHRLENLQAACSHCNQRRNILTRPKPPSRKRPTERHPGLVN